MVEVTNLLVGLLVRNLDALLTGEKKLGLSHMWTIDGSQRPTAQALQESAELALLCEDA